MKNYTGNMLIDDEYLRERHGFTDEDFVSYRYDPSFEPLVYWPRITRRKEVGTVGHVKRGEVGRGPGHQEERRIALAVEDWEQQTIMT